MMNSVIIENQIPSNSIESSKSIHICSQCTRTFKDINNFREHLFQEHGEVSVNVRQCHLCSYGTLLKSKYDCHLRCHLNNRVIRCRKCNYATINIRHMSKHERQHNLSHVVDRRISKIKRVKVENINIAHEIHTDKTSPHTPCSHENNLSLLRSNILILLRMLLPQISLYYPTIFMIDNESDQSIDQLVSNLIHISSFYRPPYSSI